MLVERGLDGGYPVGSDAQIIISEGNDGSVGGEEPGISTIGDSLPRFKEVTEVRAAPGDEGLHNGSSGVCGVIVHDYHFVSKAGRFLLKQTSQGMR